MRRGSWKLPVLLALFVLGAGLVRAQEAEPAPTEAQGEADVEGASVEVDGHHLFSVRGLTSYPAERRAAVIAGRIVDLARDPSFDPATIPMDEGERETRIGSVERPVVRVTEADAEFEGIDRKTLADAYRARVREAIVAYRASRTREALVASAWRAGLSTLFAAVALLVVLWLFRSVNRWVERRYADRVKTLSISSFEVVRAERIWGIVRGVLSFARGLALVVVIVVWLRQALSFFPWTRGVALHIDDWVLAPLAVLGSGLVAKIPNLIFLGVLFVVVRYVLRMIHLFAMAVGRGEVALQNFDPDWAEPSYKIVRVAVVAFALIVAYPYIPGSQSGAFKGVSLFVGVIFSLGSSSIISNVIAGYTMVYRRAFREGDMVRVGGVLGAVTRVRLQVTHLRTPKNEDVVVPNSTILNGEVINYSTLAKTDGLILHTTVGIGYETPWRQVVAMLIEAAGRTEGLLKEPKPFVLQTALGDFAVTYQINAYCDEPRLMARHYSALHANILDVFNEYGVQIMTPAYEGDPPEPKVVPRDKWHEPPAPRP